jgi:hypothetical protein
VSRPIGTDRLVDDMVFHFTHTGDGMDGKLAHEHILATSMS